MPSEAWGGGGYYLFKNCYVSLSVCRQTQGSVWRYTIVCAGPDSPRWMTVFFLLPSFRFVLAFEDGPLSYLLICAFFCVLCLGVGEGGGGWLGRFSNDRVCAGFPTPTPQPPPSLSIYSSHLSWVFFFWSVCRQTQWSLVRYTRVCAGPDSPRLRTFFCFIIEMVYFLRFIVIMFVVWCCFNSFLFVFVIGWVGWVGGGL